MRSLPSIAATLALLTAALVPGLASGEEGTTSATPQTFYFTSSGDGLGLSTLPPSARNATTWTTGGSYDPREGFVLEIPIENVGVDSIVDESVMPVGMIKYSVRGTYSQQPLSKNGVTGGVEWRLVEGERSSVMKNGCYYDDPYYCNHYKMPYNYTAPYPGHEAKGAAHTHGDGASLERGLHTSDFSWLLTFRLPAICSLSVKGSCLLGTYDGTYTISFVTDGSTFVTLSTLGPVAPPAPEPGEEDNETSEPTANQTEPVSNETEPTDGGNETATEEGSASESGSGEAAFEPQSYDAQTRGGKAPGASLGAILACIGAAGWWMRRRKE